MKREDILFEIQRLESRKLACASEMAASDAHAAKCIKLGIPFGELYPDELAAYQSANAEWNECDKRIQELKEQLPDEPVEGVIEPESGDNGEPVDNA